MYKNNESTITSIVLYADTILLIGNDVGKLSSVKAWLSKNFSTKHLGELTYVLGIRICKDRSTRLFGLSQSLYIDTTVKRLCMENLKKGFILMRHAILISKELSPKHHEENSVCLDDWIHHIHYAMYKTRFKHFIM